MHFFLLLYRLPHTFSLFRLAVHLTTWHHTHSLPWSILSRKRLFGGNATLCLFWSACLVCRFHLVVCENNSSAELDNHVNASCTSACQCSQSISMWWNNFVQLGYFWFQVEAMKCFYEWEGMLPDGRWCVVSDVERNSLTLWTITTYTNSTEHQTL